MTQITISDIANHLQTVRSANPLVQNITNYVVMNSTANALLAIGASPAMIHANEEAAEFASLSSSAVINIGTLSPAWVTAMLSVADEMNKTSKPWVLDPVGVGATKYRQQVTAVLQAKRPTVIRGNVSEIKTIGAIESAASKGLDSTDTLGDDRDAIAQFAQQSGTTCAVTGAEDFVTDGKHQIILRNGHEMMSKLTGTGCTASAMIGAFLGAGIPAFDASVSALAVLSVAGEIAAEKSHGPGSLQLHILDALYQMTTETLLKRVNIDVIC